MKERRKIGENERKLLPILVNYVKDNELEREDGLAIALLCNSDEKSVAMIDFLRENPNIEFDKLLEKAVEIYQSDSK